MEETTIEIKCFIARLYGEWVTLYFTNENSKKPNPQKFQSRPSRDLRENTSSSTSIRGRKCILVLKLDGNLKYIPFWTLEMDTQEVPWMWCFSQVSTQGLEAEAKSAVDASKEMPKAAGDSCKSSRCSRREYAQFSWNWISFVRLLHFPPVSRSIWTNPVRPNCSWTQLEH